MVKVFADTFYWIATVSPDDQWADAVNAAELPLAEFTW